MKVHNNHYDATVRLPLSDISGTVLNLMIRSRDGTRLQTSVYFPPDFKGKAGVLLIRSPYLPKTFIQLPNGECLKRNVVFIVQACRGTGWSEGIFDPADVDAERDDGEDLLKWLTEQPWFNGRCVTFGASYSGWCQWNMMRTGMAVLAGTAPQVAPLWGCSGSGDPGGGIRLMFSLTWLFMLHHQRKYGYTIPDYRKMKIMEHLPILSADEQAGYGRLKVVRKFLRKGAVPAETIRTIQHHFGKISVPAYVFGGWFDMFKTETILGFNLMKTRAATGKARKITRLVIGPWGHHGLLNPEIFGSGCGMETAERIAMKFLFGLLKDPDRDPVPEEPIVKYYMLGENRWCESETWPPDGVRKVCFYLHSLGHANGIDGDGSLTKRKPTGNEPADIALCDPRDPVLNDLDNPTAQGYCDRSPIQRGSNILVFTSEPFTSPMTVTGEVLLKFTASATTRDTDFFAFLTDVTPDGKAMMLASGMIRARFRNSMEREDLLVPGEKYDFEISLSHIAVKFLRGHRMRLELSGLNFPQFARNPNTGGDVLTDTELLISRHTIYHDAECPARLILPVLGKEKKAARR